MNQFSDDEWPDLGAGAPSGVTEEDKQDKQAVEEKAEKKSASTLLVEIAQERYTFGVSEAGETFGVPTTGPKVVFLLRGGKTSLRAQLAREYFTRTGKAAPQQALADALLVVEGIAQDNETERLYLRTARHDGALWLDLGDQTGRVIRITPDGWSTQDRAPVLFKRTSLTEALPEPIHGGDLGDLWEWLNVHPDDRPLIPGWLIATLFPDIPHPVLGLFGEQGTGKTTALKMLVSIIDPSAVPARKPPRDPESWVTAASGSWIVGLDNLSEIQPWLSDSLCRAVTGDGDVRRKLYTDGDLSVFSFRRCIVINGIDLGALRGDLADRLLPIDLHLISEANRLGEEDLWPAWREAHPAILGALLTLVAGVAGLLPSVHLESKPRMADFAKILAALDQLNRTAGLDRYRAKQKTMASDSLTGDLFITAIDTALGGAQFKGTGAELLALVTPTDDRWRAPKGWPNSPRQVTARLRRQAPPMRKAGWTVEDDDGASRDKTLRWTIEPPSRPREAGNEHPQDPQDPQQDLLAGVAGVAGVEYGPSQDGIHCRACGSELWLSKRNRGTCDDCHAVDPRRTA